MRIMHLSQSVLPQTMNGVSVSVGTTVNGLRSLGHDVWLVAPGTQDLAMGRLRARAIRLPVGPKDYLYAPSWQPGLWPLVIESSCQVIHVHNPFGMERKAQRVAVKEKIPFVATWHTMYEQYARHYFQWIPDELVQLYLKHRLLRFFGRCDLVIAPSQHIEQHIKSLGIQTPIKVLPTGVPLPVPEQVDERARQAMRSMLELGPSVPTLITVGRLAREKNLELLIRTVATLQKDFPDLVLLIVGDGPAREYYRQYSKKFGCASKIRFIGQVDPELIPNYLTAADIFVFGSTTEVQGLVVSEALAAGIPAITIQGAASEVITHNVDGLIVPTPEHHAFGQAVKQLLDHNDVRTRLGQNARKLASQRTPEVMVERLEDIYASLVEAR